ncbi:MAG: DUF4136 domain-containing protein [Chthoniobacterales bacterium]
MRSRLLLGLLTTLLLSGNCFAVATKVNRGTIRARSFNFVSRIGKPDTNLSDNREAVHKLIQSAITKNLAARGVKRVNGGGDINVRYLLIKGNNASTEAIRDYFGYSDELGDLHDKAHKIYTGSKNPDRFDAGTLLIDLVDGRNFKLMKRGYATRSIAGNLSSSARAARIQQAVDEILSDTKIAP